MSTRGLKKLLQQRGLEDLKIPTHDIENCSSSGEEEEEDVKAKFNHPSKKKSKLNRLQNPFDLLETQMVEKSAPKQEIHSEDDCTPLEDTPRGSENSDGSSKCKKKKKKKKKRNLDLEMDHVELTLRQIEIRENPTVEIGNIPEGCSSRNSKKSLISEKEKNRNLSIDMKFLSAELEIKKIFGSHVLERSSNPIRKNRNFRSKRPTQLVQYKESWPLFENPGLFMIPIQANESLLGASCSSVCSLSGEFRFQHSESYAKIQKQFMVAVNSLEPLHIQSILNAHPYHIDSLLQISEVFKINGDTSMADECIERALYC
eukprot:Sdes_comp17868_c0_seq1m7135